MARRTPDKVIEIGAWLLENGHRTVLTLTRGRFPKRVLGMQPVELHTTGRVSGKRRTTLLTSPLCTPGRVVLVASKGGHQDHPDWYKNLRANPEVELTVEGRTRPMLARTAEGAERDELWRAAVAAYKGYEGYQRNAERQIPVVVCEPQPADTAM